ncbi:MAG: ABC transporter permease [Segniliparus sp.]|uniref:ABC transporter permease n=1 Tax=Segniliparus sp. TaxID=2804064 RepID=UPI003F318008
MPEAAVLERGGAAAELGIAPAPADLAEGPPRADRLRRIGGKAFRQSAGVVALLLLWEIAPRAGLVDSVFLPPLSEVLKAGWKLIGNGQLAEHLGASLARASLGFAVAILLGVPLGLAIAWFPRVADYVNPVLELFRNTAPLALLPVFVLVLGIGETSKVSLVLYAAVFPVVLGTIAGVRAVDPLLVKAARSMGFGHVALFAKVVLPSAVPSVFTGVRQAAAASILVLIAAEMVGARAGLGYLITAAQSSFAIPDMYVGVLAIALIGFLVNAVIVALERRASRWREQG